MRRTARMAIAGGAIVLGTVLSLGSAAHAADGTDGTRVTDVGTDGTRVTGAGTDGTRVT